MQHAPAIRRRHADRASVGVGVQGDGDVGFGVGGQFQQFVGGSRFLRIGERDGGEVGVGGELTLDHVNIGESGPDERIECVLAADAVHRR